MTDDQFDEFLDNCYQELEDKQALLLENYNLGSYEKYWFDQVTGVLQFKNAERVECEFIVIPIGSWSSKSNSWMWAWANNSITEEFKAQSIKLKGLANYTGVDFFENGAFEADESMAHELTAMAVHYLDAMGMYIIPSSNLKTFLALVKLK